MNSTIAITGASGFIGTELLDHLKGIDGVRIIALTRGSSDLQDDPLCEWRTTDYSVGSLQSALSGADTVIHLAGVRGTTSDPSDYVINETMTSNVLKAMAADNIRSIVFAYTISVYDDESLIPWKEDSPLQGRTMYGNSKIACEDLIRKHSSENGSGYSIVRIAQVLGKGERRRGMMNVFLDPAAAGGTINVIGKSAARRQYIYVKDLVRILSMLALSCRDMKDTVNAGMPAAYTNLEIAQIVNRVYGNSTPINYNDSAPETIRSSFMDISLLKEVLSFEPLDMEQSIRALSQE